MEFYPHGTFLELLDKILKTMHGGEKPIWVVGNYGTGKTNTALVIQKLFLDDKYRVDEWFNRYKDVITQRFPDIQDELRQGREERTFVVYDYNASGVGPDRELIVRLEKSVVRELRENGCVVPPASPLSQVVKRVGEEGEAFEKKLGELRGRFQFINQAKTVDDVIQILEGTEGNDSLHALGEVEEVLRSRDIYLDVDVKGFRDWISKICDANGFGRVIFIFDEFSDFISNNTANLKTFEELAESPGLNRFMFIPITHLGLGAFRSDTANSAEKSEDRYRIHKITMPDNIAFELMAHAISHDLPYDLQKEWDEYRSLLWSAVKDAADKLNTEQSSRLQQTLEDMLPIHPMTGFMLKTLSVLIGSNQRSVFDYLSDEIGAGTFRKFIEEGGPTVWGKNLLTIDYLWDYFIENDSLEPSKDVNEIHSYYLKFRNGNKLRNKPDDDNTVRILKTILLFVLLSRLATDGAELLQPNKENVMLSYLGDSSIGSVDLILDTLCSMSCISVLNDGMICLFTSSVEDREVEKRAEELGRKFDRVNSLTKEKIANHMRPYLSSYPKDRFEIRVTNPDDVKVPNQQFIEKFGDVGKDNGRICLWFVIAKDHEESLRIIGKVKKCLEEGSHGCRLVFFSFDNVTFCSTNKNEWNDYVTALAKKELENTNSIRENYDNYLRGIETRWSEKITKCESITVYYGSESGMMTAKVVWGQFDLALEKIDNDCLKFNIDHLVKSPGIGALPSSYKSAALAGMTLIAGNNNLKKVVSQLQDAGYSLDSSWFEENPDNALTVVRNMIISRLESDVNNHRNFSLDKVYETLMRTPYGFQPVAMSALALGYCMKELTGGRYQWTDGKISSVLDNESLASIIESTIKTASGEKDRNKKEICLLTPEDQAFIDYAPKMFGVQTKAGSIKDATTLITQKFESVSNKVPIWVIPDFVVSQRDPDAEEISTAIRNVATAVSISAKGDVELRSEMIRSVGRMVIEDPELPQKVVKYITKDIFQTAFRDYIRKNYPEIDCIAEDVKDNNCYYADSILHKMAETSSYLWKEMNLDENVNQVIEEYRIVKVIREIASYSSFVSFEKAVNTLEDSIRTSMVPLSVINKKYPQVNDVIDCIHQIKKDQPSSIIAEVRIMLEQNAEMIRSLFFDNSHRELNEIVRSVYQVNDVQDSELTSIVRTIVHDNPQVEISTVSDSVYGELLKAEIDIM